MLPTAHFTLYLTLPRHLTLHGLRQLKLHIFVKHTDAVPMQRSIQLCFNSIKMSNKANCEAFSLCAASWLHQSREAYIDLQTVARHNSHVLLHQTSMFIQPHGSWGCAIEQTLSP